MPVEPAAGVRHILTALATLDQAPQQPATSDHSTGVPVLPAALGRPWFLVSHGENTDERTARLRLIERNVGTLPLDRAFVPSHRRPVVIGHGPELLGVLPELKSARDRLWLLAPFRTSLQLAAVGVIVDVIVLAERDALPHGTSLAEWRALPADLRAALCSSLLVVDAFVPFDLLLGFTATRLFDSGLGGIHEGTRLPYLGFTSVSALALAILTGHRAVAIVGFGGVSADERLRRILEVIGAAADLRLVACGLGQAPSGCVSMPLTAFAAEPVDLRPTGQDAFLMAPPRLVERADLLRREEYQRFSELRRHVAAGLELLRSPDAGSPSQIRSFVEDILHLWKCRPEVRALMLSGRADLSVRFWQLAGNTGLVSRDPSRSVQAIARMMLPELHEALRWCEARLT